MKNNPRIMLAATGSGAGKTTVTCALLKALSQNGYQVASFKAGPDYIDPMFHKEVLGVPSCNLDLYMLGEETCKYFIHTNGEGMDLSVIEGVMGFYDGIGTTWKGSSYELAQKTQTPVILVVGCKGMALSVIPLIKGYMDFEKNTIAGVILNEVTKGMYPYYKEMIESQLSVKVLGHLPKLPECSLESRHLGLITAEEVVRLEEKIEKLGEVASETLDLEGITALAKTSKPLVFEISPIETMTSSIRIGVARDKAFCFYYEENLKLLQKMGAELVYFSPMYGEKLPEHIDGLLLGGGYPEVYAEQIARNTKMKASILRALQGGLPCIAECGGFMYLQERLTKLEGESFEMVGYLPGEASMTTSLKRFGYIELEAQTNNLLSEEGEKIRAHEFHYSDSTVNGGDFKASKPLSHRGWECIVTTPNVFAGYPHIHFYSNLKFPKAFMESCMAYHNREK